MNDLINRALESLRETTQQFAEQAEFLHQLRAAGAPPLAPDLCRKLADAIGENRRTMLTTAAALGRYETVLRESGEQHG